MKKSPRRDPEISFREIAGDVRSLPVGPRRIPGAETPALRLEPAKDADGPELSVRRAGESVRALAPGVDADVLDRLAAGLLAPRKELDVHGMTIPEARRALARLLRDATTQNVRTLLVVHGRGLHSGPEGSTLREEIIDRLATRHAGVILAFCSAPSRWGGTGALVVRLRRGAPLRTSGDR